jgi:GT2 family glycosyltransferase
VAPVPGLSHARNCAVREARGQYLCWADDDVLLDRGWLAAYVSAFRRHPDAALFGGCILPLLDRPVPHWVRASLGGWHLQFAFAHRETGAIVPIAHGRDQLPWGANYAVRAAEQRRLVYDPQLGLSPGLCRLGEECDLAFRMLQQGASGWWVPDAGVRHVIARDRQTHAYVQSYYAKMARTAAYLDPGSKRVSRPELMLRVVAYQAMLIAAIVLRLHALRVTCLARIGYCTGLLSVPKPEGCKPARIQLAASRR